MSVAIDCLAALGLAALLIVLTGTLITVRRLRAANRAISSARSVYSTSYLAAAVDRDSGEEATPSAYTIPERPSP